MTIALRLCLLLVISLAIAPVAAQDLTPDAVIAIAVELPEFADGLAANPGWRARAYDPGSALGVWRVEFTTAAGEELAWGVLHPGRRRLYSHQVFFEPPAGDQQRAEAVILPFLHADPLLTELLGTPSAYPMYVGYDSWQDGWGVWVENGIDSLWMIVRFADPAALSDPILAEIYFANLPTYDEWSASIGALAVSLAYQDGRIAAALRDRDDVRSDSQPLAGEESIWVIAFYAGDELVMTAQVDVRAQTVIAVGGRELFR